MKKIVITGGPCAGKTTVVNALKSEIQLPAVFVSEAATLVLEGKFPPRPDESKVGVELIKQWNRYFQNAVLYTQLAHEDAAELEGKEKNLDLMVLDRSLYDGMAYYPEGVDGYSEAFKVWRSDIKNEFDLVIFMESLAVCRPEMFGRDGNEHRYESSAKEAIEVNNRLLEVYEIHPNLKILPAELALREKKRAANRWITELMRPNR